MRALTLNDLIDKNFRSGVTEHAYQNFKLNTPTAYRNLRTKEDVESISTMFKQLATQLPDIELFHTDIGRLENCLGHYVLAIHKIVSTSSLKKNPLYFTIEEQSLLVTDFLIVLEQFEQLRDRMVMKDF